MCSSEAEAAKVCDRKTANSNMNTASPIRNRQDDKTDLERLVFILKYLIAFQLTKCVSEVL